MAKWSPTHMASTFPCCSAVTRGCPLSVFGQPACSCRIRRLKCGNAGRACVRACKCAYMCEQVRYSQTHSCTSLQLCHTRDTSERWWLWFSGALRVTAVFVERRLIWMPVGRGRFRREPVPACWSLSPNTKHRREPFSDTYEDDDMGEIKLKLSFVISEYPRWFSVIRARAQSCPGMTRLAKPDII